jgi:carboxymethylenebutenolidase
MGERISFNANGHRTDGYLARPDFGGGPGVVVIQEWWGLVPHIVDVTDRLATAGFVALAPDLYHGTQTKSPDEAGKLMMSLQIDRAAVDLASASAHLLAQPGVAPGGVGVIGFCMGGALSLYAASRQPNVGACVVFYGIHPNVEPDLAALRAPVLGIFADGDTLVTPDMVSQLDSRLTKADKRHEFHTYPGTGHAFFNNTSAEHYDEVAARDAWNRTLQFFHAELAR